MKRGKGLKRKTPLSADPEKTQAFVNRGRANGLGVPPPRVDWEAVRRGEKDPPRQWTAKGSPTRPGKVTITQGPAEPRQLASVRFKARTPANQHRCAACGARAQSWHHVVPQQALRRHVVSLRLPNFPAARNVLNRLLKDERGHIASCMDCHLNHEAGRARFTRDLLHDRWRDFTAELDVQGPGEWATVMVERAHPVSADDNARRAA